MWNASKSELKAGEEIKKKLFWLINEYSDCLNDRNFRQQIKALFGSYILMVDTEPDKSDSDRLLYDLYDEISKHTKWKFSDYENMMYGMFY